MSKIRVDNSDQYAPGQDVCYNFTNFLRLRYIAWRGRSKRQLRRNKTASRGTIFAQYLQQFHWEFTPGNMEYTKLKNIAYSIKVNPKKFIFIPKIWDSK